MYELQRAAYRRDRLLARYGIAVFPDPGPPPVDRAHIRRAARNALVFDTIGHPPNPVGPTPYLTDPPAPRWA